MRAIAVLLCGLWATPGWATTVLRLDIPTLTKMSEHVVVGRVVDQRSRIETWGDGTSRSPHGLRVVTDTLIEIDEVLAGLRSVPVVTLTQLGGSATGEDGPLVERVFGYPTFEVGEHVLLFLEQTDTGRLVVAGLAQGTFRLSTDSESGALMAERDLDGLRVVAAGGHSIRRVGSPQTSIDRLPLHQLRAQIAGQRMTRVPVRVRRVLPRDALPTTPVLSTDALEETTR